MKGKRIWYLIPQAILPYVLLFTLVFIFFSTRVPFFLYIFEHVFHNNGLWIPLLFLIYCQFAIGISILCFVKSIRECWDPLSIAKCAAVLKLAQMPAYFIIFILAVMFSVTVFLYVVAILMFFIDCLTLCLSGLLVLSSVINASKKDILKFNGNIWILALQCIFCADVVASIIYFYKLKKHVLIKYLT